MIEELGGVLSGAELLASYRRADDYVGDRASELEHERLRLCGHIVLDKLEKLNSAEEELIGGTLEDEVNYFEGATHCTSIGTRNGSVTRAARELGLTHQGLSDIIDGRHSKTLAGARRPKRNRGKSIMTH